MQFCHSCTMPLSDETWGANKEVFYCRHCTNEQGELQPREDVQRGIAGWLMSWQPNITQEQAFKRAGHFMLGLPAWAED